MAHSTPSNPSPGPDADAAFTLGLAASAVLFLSVIAFSVWTESVTHFSAIAFAVLGFPVVFVVSSCLLAVWLGYDENAVDAFRLTEARREYAEE